MDMVCIVFEDQQMADSCLDKLQSLQDQSVFELEDACVAIRDEAGKVYLKQTRQRVAIGAGVGAFGGYAWGLLLGFLAGFNPIVISAAGTVVLATVGGLIGKMNDFGIDDNFIKGIAAELQPGTSAVFVMFGRLTPDKVLPHLRQFHGKILTTNLPAERAERLRIALAPLVEQQVNEGSKDVS